MRPIDADTTLSLLKSLGSRDYRRSKGTIAEAEKMLMHEEYTPTLDVEPVRHGHWKEQFDELGLWRGWKCSCCRCSVYQMTYEPYEYCPHCGAKLDMR